MKTPGDGRTYSVGVTTVSLASIQPGQSRPFSNTPSTGDLSLATSRQVVILQASGPAGIQWQKYFFGSTSFQTSGGLATHASAISVFPGATPAETRIAICGATYDQTLPASAATNNLWANTSSSGWIADSSPLILPSMPGMEVWLDTSLSVSQLYVTSGTSLRVPLGPLPTGPGVFSIQFISMLSLPGGATPPCNDPAAMFVGSPALVFGY